MDSHMDLLGELASDAALERQDFIFQATEQLRKFLDHHRERIARPRRPDADRRGARLPSIAPDLSFRSRSRYHDETTGEWVSETEVIESAAELIELYNPADIFAAFADAAREAAGLRPRPPPRARSSRQPGSRREETVVFGEDPTLRGRRLVGSRPAGLARGGRRGVGGPATVRPRPRVSGAKPAERGPAPRGIRGRRGRLVRDPRRPDHRRRRRRAAHPDGDRCFRAEVIPEDAAGRVADARDADELVEFYDPTDVFGDLADAIAEGFPSVAPELAGGRRRRRSGRRRRPRGRRRRATSKPRRRRTRARTTRPRDDAAGHSGAGRTSRDPAGPVAPGVPRPGVASGCRAGQFVHIRTGDFSGMVLRRPFSINTADPSTGIVTIHFRASAAARMVHPAPTGRSRGHARAARPPVRGRPAQPAPAPGRGRAGDGRRPDARRRGDPRRPPGDAAVRRRFRARGLSEQPAAGRGRVRGCHR